MCLLSRSLCGPSFQFGKQRPINLSSMVSLVSSCSLASLCLQNLVSFGWDHKHTRRWNVSGGSMGLPVSKALHVMNSLGMRINKLKQVHRWQGFAFNILIFPKSRVNIILFNVEILQDVEVLCPFDNVQLWGSRLMWTPVSHSPPVFQQFLPLNNFGYEVSTIY